MRPSDLHAAASRVMACVMCNGVCPKGWIVCVACCVRTDPGTIEAIVKERDELAAWIPMAQEFLMEREAAEGHLRRWKKAKALWVKRLARYEFLCLLRAEGIVQELRLLSVA